MFPLKRTPPPSPASPATFATPFFTATPPAPAKTLEVPDTQPLHACSSEPNLMVNTSQRKRKHDVDFLEFMSEMKLMFASFKAGQEKTCERLCSAVEDMRSTVEFLSQKIDSLQNRVEKLEDNRKADSLYTKSLEDRLDAFERNSRATCLEIRNLPVSPTETKTNLMETVINMSKMLKAPIQENQIKDVFRIRNKNPANKTIIVELTSVLSKERVVEMFRKFNKTSRFTTEHLHISGPAVPIFVAENLTSRMKRLFFLAREAAKAADYQFCWVSHGKIFARRRENAPVVRITTELDLELLKVAC